MNNVKHKYFEEFQLDWDRRKKKSKPSKRTRALNLLKQRFLRPSQVTSPSPSHQNRKANRNYVLEVEEIRAKAIMYSHFNSHH
jgi:uncharacterized DUF497 family protein